MHILGDLKHNEPYFINQMCSTEILLCALSREGTYKFQLVGY